MAIFKRSTLKEREGKYIEQYNKLIKIRLKI